ncbi:methyl-accepting chemotaxis protein [Acetobacterium wieringae]|uniref:methyl-accepting chemotaxis protein n=1 Tax=Acetobacterium wieringae TaxID=52694 RepID=UPI0026F1297A|nr:methyl-accepting chemotaxis protein [Acetobacterium wieringae]
MKWFYDMKIRTKLLSGFMVVALIVGIIGYVGIKNILELDHSSTVLYEKITIPVEESGSMSTAFQRMRVNIRDMIAANDAQSIQDFTNRIAERQRDIDEIAKDFEQTLITDEMKTAFVEFNEARKASDAEFNTLITLATQNQDAEALARLAETGPAGIASRAEQDALEKLVALKIDEAKATAQANSDLTNSVITTMSIFIGIGILVAMILGFILSSIICKPLRQASHMLKEMSQGHLSERLGLNTKDEIGQMSSAMDQFADDLQNMVIGTMNQISNGDVSANISLNDPHDEISPALKRTIDTIQSLITDATMLSQSAVEGRLNTRGNADAFSGGFKEIMAGVNATLDALVGFIDVMPSPVLIIDNDFSILYLNELGAQVAGLEKSSAIGKNCYSLFNTSDCRTEKCACSRAMNSSSAATSETDAHPTGLDLDISYTGVPIMDRSGNTIGALEIITDLTAIKQAERRMLKIADYQQNETDKLVDGLTKLSCGNTAVNIVLADGDEDTRDVHDTFQIIGDSVNKCVSSISALVADAHMLAQAAQDGHLNARADASRHEGDFAEIVTGINSTLDAVIEPLTEASKTLKELAQGNLNSNMIGDYNGDYVLIKNDMNQTIAFLKNYVDEIAKTLLEMGQGNLDIEITTDYLGDFQAIKTGLNGIAATLSDTMAEINEAAGQVEAGARQISDGGQALSQGTTEQASAIQQLNASIEEVAGETKKNATNANEANERALEVRSNAEVGNEQMTKMVSAMIDINESSKSISKIIKVIDDIAFQTNILALNAAVEAARAGSHGKGFAVVAEEVRSLAARSAEAAKETTGLIEGSIDKVEAGTRIADETAASLVEILNEIEKVTGLVGNIARASNDQATEIAQITQGIEQVSTVVQTNSATAEESAAASEELSGQAQMLKQMVGAFKLKKKGAAHHTSPRPPVEKPVKQKDTAETSPQIVLDDLEMDKY